MEPNESLTQTLKKAGLTDLQSKAYLILIQSPKPLTATDLAEKLGEKRTNGYAIAERLVTIGLATKDENGPKPLAFSPTHPTNLEAYAEKRRKIVERNEKEVKTTIPSLINFYNQYQKSPGISVHFGNEGIAQVYDQILKTGQKLHLLRSRKDGASDNLENTHKFRDNRVEQGIPVEIISPSTNPHSVEENQKNLADITYIPPEDYDSPIEIDVFGDQVAFIDYSLGNQNESMSAIITSPHIAESLRQLFQITKKYFEASKKPYEPPPTPPAESPPDPSPDH